MVRRLTNVVSCVSITLLLNVLCGCKKEEEPPPAYETPTPSPNQGSPFELNGTFASRQVTSQNVKRVPCCGYVTQTITSYFVVTLEEGEAENEVIYRQRPCYTDLTPVQGADSSFLQGFYDNTPVYDVVATVTGSEIGESLTVPEQLELRGVHSLANPATDVLPSEVEDPNVYDYDLDGNAGYTVVLSGAIDGWLWVVERYRYSLSGTFDDADAISGLMTSVSEQSIMEVSSSLIPKDPTVEPDTTEGHNFFNMYRVEEPFSCDDLMANVDTLFPVLEEAEPTPVE